MVAHRVDLLVNKDNQKKVLGVISERDVINALAKKTPTTTTVDKVGTIHNFVYADEPITAAARSMKQHKVRHVVVLDRNGEVYGVISIRDVLGERAILEILARGWAPTIE